MEHVVDCLQEKQGGHANQMPVNWPFISNSHSSAMLDILASISAKSELLKIASKVDFT